MCAERALCTTATGGDGQRTVWCRGGRDETTQVEMAARCCSVQKAGRASDTERGLTSPCAHAMGAAAPEHGTKLLPSHPKHPLTLRIIAHPRRHSLQRHDGELPRRCTAPTSALRVGPRCGHAFVLVAPCFEPLWQTTPAGPGPCPNCR